MHELPISPWQPHPESVYAFQNVFDAADQFLGTVYLDIDRRPTKAVGDCHFTVRCSKQVIIGHQFILWEP